MSAFIVMVAAAIYGGFHYQNILSAISELSGTIINTGVFTEEGKEKKSRSGYGLFLAKPKVAEIFKKPEKYDLMK